MPFFTINFKFVAKILFIMASGRFQPTFCPLSQNFQLHTEKIVKKNIQVFV